MSAWKNDDSARRADGEGDVVAFEREAELHRDEGRLAMALGLDEASAAAGGFRDRRLFWR